MKNCAIVGWEEGLAGQVSQWINYNIKFYIHPFKKKPKIDLKKIRGKPSKNFQYPKNNKYLNVPFIVDEDWCVFLKKKKINQVLILISNGKLRNQLIKKIKKNKIKVLTVIHKSAVILNKKLIGAGSIIEPFVFIGHNVEVSQGLLIQEKSSIEHNSVIGCGVTINPGSIINGNCHLMKYVTIHSGCTLFNNVRVGENSKIGAGSLVNKNIKRNTLAFGRPIKEIKKI